VGHFLAGVAVGWWALPAETLPRTSHASPHVQWKALWKTCVFGCAAVAPDVDFLFHSHRTATHSVTAVLLVFVVTLAVRGRPHANFAAALAGAVASHLLLDWVSDDPVSPTGIMLLWPLSREYFSPPAAVFLSIRKDLSQPGAYAHNAFAVMRELLILLPIAGVVRWVRR